MNDVVVDGADKLNVCVLFVSIKLEKLMLMMPMMRSESLVCYAVSYVFVGGSRASCDSLLDLLRCGMAFDPGELQRMSASNTDGFDEGVPKVPVRSG